MIPSNYPSIQGGQAYETDESIMIIEQWGKSIRAVLFKKEGDGFRFSDLLLNDGSNPHLIEKLIVKLNFRLTDKKLIIR